MADEIKSNLEPIEESDLNLKEKFLEKSVNADEKEGALEISSTEKTIERKEGAAEKEAAYTKILSKIGTKNQAVQTGVVATDADMANQGMDAESKIVNLVSIAQAKGIAHAVKVAQHMEDNYALDEFHDRLLGKELHSALVQKGMIKEV